MKTDIILCRILVGTAAMVRSADRHGSVSTTPWEFECSHCGAEWGGHSISVGVDLKTVSCSNCYSDSVYLTRIRIGVPETCLVDGSTDDQIRQRIRELLMDGQAQEAVNLAAALANR